MGAVDQVREGSGKVWSDFLRPVGERIASAAPAAVKATALLILFWIVAVIAGWTVTWLLGKTDLDNRLARDLGLEKTLAGLEKRGSSLEKIVGTALKWVILLFGLVAFFNALDLTMVAGPLGNVLTKIAEVVPALLRAFSYLALYWVVATLLKFAITKGLGAAGFDERVERWVKPREVKGELVGPGAMVGRLVFWVVLLFGLPPFLEALGQQAAVEPLRNMMSRFFEFLPNVAAALILLFVGRVVATIVREVVTNFLQVAGADELAKRAGLGTAEHSRQLSEIVGAVAFFFVFIAILVAAVDALQISAISEPVKLTLEQVLAAVPLVIVASLVMAVGYLVARTVRGLVEGLLGSVGFDQLPERVGLGFLIPKRGAGLSSIAGSVLMVIILLLTAQQALASLKLYQLSDLLGEFFGYLPNLFVGVFILLAAFSLGAYVARVIGSLTAGSPYGKLAALAAKYGVFFLGFSMGLNQLGVAREVLQITVAAVLGGTALALGLAFGLGGQQRARDWIDRLGKVERLEGTDGGS